MSSNIFQNNQKIVIFLLILSLFMPLFGFCQETPIKVPGTIDEAKDFIKNGFRIVLEKMPTVLKTIWREQVLPIWKKMWNLFKNTWASYIKNFLHNLWYSSLKPQIQSLIQKVKGLLGIKIEQQKPIIEEEFQKEKKEMQKEIPKAAESFWQKFKELLK